MSTRAVPHGDVTAALAKHDTRLDAHKSAADRLREEFDDFQTEVRADINAIRTDVHSVKLSLDSQDKRRDRGAAMWIQLITSLTAIAVAVIALLR